jgi:hypothetical protein
MYCPVFCSRVRGGPADCPKKPGMFVTTFVEGGIHSASNFSVKHGRSGKKKLSMADDMPKCVCGGHEMSCVNV